MKYLIVEFSDRKRYAIPTEFIADHRAKYYAKKDSERGLGRYDVIYDEELFYAIDDDYELLDWASNNMDWKGVKDQAILLETKVEPTDYDKEWTNAKMVIEFIKPSELDD